MKKNILLSLLILISCSVFGQQRITGEIIGKKGEVLEGATVFIEGTTNGAFTDSDGNFSIEVSCKEEKIVLVIRFTKQPLTTKEITCTDKSKQDLGTIQMIKKKKDKRKKKK